MTEFIKLIFSPGMLPFTLLLILIVGYWLIVMIGLVDIEIFDFGDFGLDGVLDEAGEAIEAAGESTNAFDSLLGFLSVGSVPVSIILSFFTIQMWIIAFLLNYFLPDSIKTAIPLVLFVILMVLVVGIISLFITGVTTRPFRPLFKHKTTHGHHHLVGKICKVTTSKVTETFGQAELKVDQSHLIISVFCRSGDKFETGEDAVITKYNKKDNSYEIVKIS